jgi:intein/homing endonuclease
MLHTGLISNAPYYKGKGFCVNPVVKYGIPACADSRRNKKVIGTADYERYWEEQLYYCKNGYQTGGLWVPGRFYYYMNFNNMSTINGVITPDMVDLHLELAYLIEYAKANGKNIISAKGRRKGISEFTHKAVIDYGWRFNFPSSNALAGAYQGAVAAGQDIYAQDFMTKWRAGDALVVPEFRVKKLLNNDDEVIGGYEIQNEESDWNEEGSKAKIYVRTAFKTGNIFKGLYLNDAIAEEGGEFIKLKEFYSATKDCLMDGDKQIGTFFFYGCVCAGTKVWDNYGNLINIEDLKPENGIIGFNQEKGGFSKEEITYWQPPHEKECYKITTNTGRILECSDDHPILKRIKRKNSPSYKGVEFVEAQNLKTGDRIATIEQVDIWSEKRMFEPRLTGWIVGDGSYHNAIWLMNADEEMYNYTSSKFYTRVYHEEPTKDGRILRKFLVNGVNLRNSFREMEILGQTKDRKRLPKNIHSYCKEDVCEFIGGYFDADGCAYTNDKTKETFLKLTSANYEILHETRLVLQKLGIRCNIMFEKPNFNNPKTTRRHFNLIIKDKTSINRFNENIKFSIKYKQDNLERGVRNIEGVNPRKAKSFKGLRFEEVILVEPIGKKPVYNLTAGTTNTYVANGIVTHNTGGKITKESKDFKEIYYNQDAFNFIEFTILAPRFYKPNYGGATRGGQDISEIPNLLKTHKPFELIGVEDTQEAERAIREKRAEFLKKGQLKEYNEDRQNNPLSKEDIFLSTAVNEFDINKLNDQLFAIDSNPPKYIRCKIDWETDGRGEIKQPLATKLVPLPPEDERKDFVLVHVDYFAPIKTYSHLYCAGIDSYDQDTSRTSKSLGAMCVLIRRNNIPGALELAPIATIRCRPERKEKFYELCLKLSVHYNLVESVLVDVRCPLIIEYFKQRGCERFLAYRPTKFEKENSEQTNTYGVSLNINSRPQMVSIMQSAIFDFAQNIWFRTLIEELLNFDDVAIGSDNDLADAYGIALMQDVANTVAPQDNKDFSFKEMYELGGEFKTNENGDIVPAESNPFKGEEHDHPNLL